MADPETTDPYVTIRLSPKAARFAATACETMADADLEDENDRGLYATIADVIREALK